MCACVCEREGDGEEIEATQNSSWSKDGTRSLCLQCNEVSTSNSDQETIALVYLGLYRYVGTTRMSRRKFVLFLNV